MAIQQPSRFELLMKYIYLNDSEKQPPRGSDDYDKLYKVQPLLDLVVSAFKMLTHHTNPFQLMRASLGSRGDCAGCKTCQINSPCGASKHGF